MLNQKERIVTCNQCDYLATTLSSLRTHIQSEHEGSKYNEHHATLKGDRRHIHNKQKDIKSGSNQKDYEAATPRIRRTHTEPIHKGISYSCNQCQFEVNSKSYLKVHFKLNHGGVLVSNKIS